MMKSFKKIFSEVFESLELSGFSIMSFWKVNWDDMIRKVNEAKKKKGG